MNSEILFRPMLRFGVVMSVYLLIFFLTGREDVLSLAILGGGLFIASEGLGLGYRLVAMHFLMGVAAFLVLYVLVGWPFVFAAACGGLAMAVVSTTRLAAKLRSFGNWIFIPAVYAACDLGEGRSVPERLNLLATMWPVLLIGPVCVALLVPSQSGKISGSLDELVARLGNPNPEWKPQAWAAFASVALIAAVAIGFHLPNSQWMIWSSLSVIAIDLPSTRAKFKDRFLGVVAGCPTGFIVGLAVPPTRAIYSLAILGILLSLVSIRTYRLAFSVRCALTAFAAVVAGGTIAIAEERVVNVIVGGITGLVVVHIAHEISRFGRKDYSDDPTGEPSCRRQPNDTPN